MAPFSGLGFRVVFLASVTAILILFLLWSCSKRVGGKSEEMPTAEPQEVEPLKRPRAVLSVILACFGLMIGSGALVVLIPAMSGLAFPLIGMTLLLGGVFVAVLQGCQGREMKKAFGAGVASFSPAVVLILLATSIPWLVEKGGLMGPLLTELAHGIKSAGWSREGTALSMYVLQIP